METGMDNISSGAWRSGISVLMYIYPALSGLLIFVLLYPAAGIVYLILRGEDFLPE